MTSRKNNQQNVMNVLSDEENWSSTLSSQKSYTLDIILHKPADISCLANSMSIDSDSDSDFVSSPHNSHRVKPITPKQNKSRSSSSVSRTSLKNNTAKSQQRQTKNINETVQKIHKIKVISNEKVNINANSIRQSNVKSTKALDQRKTKVSRNLFNINPSTNTDKKNEEIAIRTDNEPQVLVTKSVDKRIKNKDAQITGTTNIRNPNSNNYLKRPHNMSTQTNVILENFNNEKDLDDIRKREPVKNKVTEIQVSPPKRSKTIPMESPIIKFIEEQQDKLEAVKINISKLLEASTSELYETPKKPSNIKPLKTSTSVKNNTKTSMKQATLTEIFFCKSTETSSGYATPCSSSTKSTCSLSPIKLKNKKPEKKKDTKYSQENHNRVYENVKKIVNWVFQNNHFSILFTKSEKDLLQKLFSFPDKRLTVICIRLYTRQHKWYNFLNFCDELNLTYEGFNLLEYCMNLKSGFVNSDYSGETIQTLLTYLPQPDIKKICNDFKITTVYRKMEMINKLIDYSNKQCTLTSLKSADDVLRDRVKQKLGICVKLDTNFKDILNRIHILYSLTNSDLEGPNDLYNLMNRMRFEQIQLPQIKIDTPLLFSSRKDFLKFSEACVLKKEFYEQIDLKDINNIYLLSIEAFERLKKLLSSESQIEFDKKKPLFLRRFSSSWVYCKVLSTSSQNLGKSHPLKVCEWLKEMLKQDIYCPNSRGYWYCQLALITKAHLKNIIGEAEFIIEGLRDKHVNEVQKHELSIRGSKIKKGKLSQLLYDELQCVLLPEIEIPILRTIKANVVHNNEPGKKLKFVRITAEGKEYSSVEETAINYYTTEDKYTHGIHCEGQLLDALFIVLFYDIIFMHVQDTFITEIQAKPLDLYTNEFYLSRQNKINKRLKDIRENFIEDDVCEFALKVYSDHESELRSLISFDFVKKETFYIIIKCIGQKILAAIMERFAKDYKQFHSGLPDLFLWNYKEFTSCFVEVKSENDKLSTKQILWINYLHKFGAKVEVCQVQHIGSRSVKKTKIPKETPE